MQIIETKDRARLAGFLKNDPFLHLYELGNLQEKLFSHTRWHMAEMDGEILAVSMQYFSKKNPILFLLENKETLAARTLMEGIKGELPSQIYCHISKGLEKALANEYRFKEPVEYIKMRLTGDILLRPAVKYEDYTYRINENDFEPVNDFLKSINPDAFFVPAMLKTGKYFCIRKDNNIISIAGVHFFDREQSVAAIGNIATIESERNKGYAKSVLASLCLDMWNEVQYMGLNVRADNITAIKAYEKLGFVEHSRHFEITAQEK
ncbi:MAG: GNAT family N-acetyltransferase [Spirochaetia bacterium]|nr:GNAT family N-acetyltransferase [Spirochaetia bacterium]